MKVRVKGKSAKGHSRIGAFGPIWKVKRTSSNVGFAVNSGLWLLLESLDGKWLRWCHATEDRDFELC